MKENSYKISFRKKGDDIEYILNINGNDIIIDKRIFDEELFGFEILRTSNLLDNLKIYFKEAEEQGLASAMNIENDIEEIEDVEDDFIFNDLQMNNYVYKSGKLEEFNNLCNALYELNNSTLPISN